MSNVTIGGIDRRKESGSGEAFAYYETAAGGMGARPGMDGISGVHTHMTNSLNTPIEALEYAYPFRVRRYGYREGSGGEGKFRGGDGLIRELELLGDAEVTLLADRRKFLTFTGWPAVATVQPAVRGSRRQRAARELSCRESAAGGSRRRDTLRIETPGGGGWGRRD